MNDAKENENGVREESGKKNDPARERLQNLSRRGFNAATGGAWDKARNAPIIGAAAKKMEQKAADKLSNTKLGKKLSDPANHKRPNLGVPTKQSGNTSNTPEASNTSQTSQTEQTKKSDVGSRNLQNSLKNKAKNIWQQRKKKKKTGEESDTGNNNESSDSNNSESEDKKDEDDEHLSGAIPTKKLIRIRIYIIAGLVGVALFCFYFLVMMVAIALGGDISSKSAPVAATKQYEEDDPQYVTPEGSKARKEEEAFKKKLEEVTKDNPDININYVIATLMQMFYERNYTQDVTDEDEIKRISDSGGVDYVLMTEWLDKFVNVIKEANSDDYEIDGEIYNALKESSDFEEYYEKVLKEKDKDEVLERIFELGEELTELDAEDEEELVITGETEVEVTGNGGVQPVKMTINDYIGDSIYATGINVGNAEAVKAYTIALSTNIVAKNKELTIDANNATMTGQLCSITEGCSYDKSGNLVKGAGERSSKNTIFYNGGYYYKKPLNDSEVTDISKNINSVFGNVLVKSNGTYPELDLSKIVGHGDGDYKTILKNSYGDYNIKNIGESSYVLDVSYGDKKVKTDVIFYDQSDYPGQFCGLSGATIKGSGCGVTSMAIVVSTYENNKKYDPTWANDIARKNGQCGRDGTNYSHFTSVSKQMGYKTTVYQKNKASKWKISKSSYNNVLKHLSNGDLVIINVRKGHFTGGGHYMVLGGVDPETKKVYVYDPNNKSNSSYRKTGNGWWSFNDIIVPETKAFFIIKKKG